MMQLFASAYDEKQDKVPELKRMTQRNLEQKVELDLVKPLEHSCRSFIPCIAVREDSPNVYKI